MLYSFEVYSIDSSKQFVEREMLHEEIFLFHYLSTMFIGILHQLYRLTFGNTKIFFCFVLTKDTLVSYEDVATLPTTIMFSGDALFVY